MGAFIYDSNGMLLFSGLDKAAALAYARLFELAQFTLVIREPSVQRPDLPIRRLTGFPSPQRQVNTKRVNKPLPKQGLACVQIPAMTRSPALHQNSSDL